MHDDDTPRSPRSKLVTANWLPSTQHLNQDGGRGSISQLGREVPGNEITRKTADDFPLRTFPGLAVHEVRACVPYSRPPHSPYRWDY